MASLPRAIVALDTIHQKEAWYYRTLLINLSSRKHKDLEVAEGLGVQDSEVLEVLEDLEDSVIKGLIASIGNKELVSLVILNPISLFQE